MLSIATMFPFLLACSVPEASRAPAAPSPPAADTGARARCSDTPVLAEVTFAGSCLAKEGEAVEVDFADVAADYAPLPILEAEQYDTRVQVAPSALGYARVRSRPVFVAADERNMLTTVPACTTLLARGPTKLSPGSQGLAWGVRLVDAGGARCQGFLSDTVVTPLDGSPLP
jgi:hypothetical protein